MMRSSISLRGLLLVALSSFALAGCGGGGGNNGGGCTTFGAVCLYTPLEPAARTPCGDVTEYCDPTSTAAPNLACLTTPKSDGSGPSQVTLTGFVHVFSSGPDSANVSIALFAASDLAGGADPTTVTPLAHTVAMLDPTTQRACDALAANGCSIPSATGCTLPVCNDGLDGRTDPRWGLGLGLRVVRALVRLEQALTARPS